MLDSVKIVNFRCLKEVEVPLRPLTVLVGPNDTGKSAFLEGIEYLGVEKTYAHEDHWQLRKDMLVAIVETSGETTIESRETHPQRGGQVVAPVARGRAARLRPTARFRCQTRLAMGKVRSGP